MPLKDTLLVISESSEIRNGIRNIRDDSFNILEASSDSQALMLFTQNTYSIGAFRGFCLRSSVRGSLCQRR